MIVLVDGWFAHGGECQLLRAPGCLDKVPREIQGFVIGEHDVDHGGVGSRFRSEFRVDVLRVDSRSHGLSFRLFHMSLRVARTVY